MFKVLVFISLLISSAYGQGTYVPGIGQEPVLGPMRSSYDPLRPGDKMITIADLDSTFVKTVARVGNTLNFTLQDALNAHQTFSYTPDVGVTGAYLKAATANTNDLLITSVDANGAETTITFSPPGGGSGITGSYVSDASASGNTLTLTLANADGSTPPPAVTFSPSGGISGPYVSAVNVSGTSMILTITETDGSTRDVPFSATPGGTGLTAQDRLEIQDLTSSRFHTGGYIFGQHYPREFFFDQQSPPRLRDVALRNNRLFAISDEDPPRYAFLGAHTPLTIPGHQTNEEIRGFTFTETYAVEVTNQRVRQFTVANDDQITAIGGSGAIDKEHIIAVASPPTGDLVYVAQRFESVPSEDDRIQITRYNLSASGPTEAYASSFTLTEIQASVSGEGLANPTNLNDIMVIEATTDNIFLTIRTRYEIIQTAIDDTGTGFEFDAVAHHKGGWLESVVGALRTPLLEYVCTPYVVLQYDISPDAPLTAEDYRVIFHDSDGPPLEPPTNAAQIAKDRTGKLFPAISRHIRHSTDPTMTTTNIAPINGLVVYWRGFNANLGTNNGFFTWVTDSNRFWQRVQDRNSPTSWSTVWQRIQGLDPSEDYRSTIYLGHFTSAEAATNAMSNNSTAIARYTGGTNPSDEMAVYWIDTSNEQLKRVTGFTSGTTTETDELVWGTHPLTQDEINVLLSAYRITPSAITATNTPTAGQVPTYADGSNFTWADAVDEVTPANLDATNTPADGQVPTFNASESEFTWRDQPTPGEGGLNESQVDARITTLVEAFARQAATDIPLDKLMDAIRYGVIVFQPRAPTEDDYTNRRLFFDGLVLYRVERNSQQHPATATFTTSGINISQLGAGIYYDRAAALRAVPSPGNNQRYYNRSQNRWEIWVSTGSYFNTDQNAAVPRLSDLSNAWKGEWPDEDHAEAHVDQVNEIVSYPDANGNYVLHRVEAFSSAGTDYVYGLAPVSGSQDTPTIKRPIPSLVDANFNDIYGVGGSDETKQRHLEYKRSIADSIVAYSPSDINPTIHASGQEIYGWTTETELYTGLRTTIGGYISPTPDNIEGIIEWRNPATNLWVFILATDGTDGFSNTTGNIQVYYTQTFTGLHGGNFLMSPVSGQAGLWQSSNHISPRFEPGGGYWDLRFRYTAETENIVLHGGDEFARIADFKDVEDVKNEIHSITRDIDNLIDNGVKEFARTGQREIQSADIEDETVASADIEDGTIVEADLATSVTDQFGGNPLKRLANLLDHSSAIDDLELGRNDETIAFRKPIDHADRFLFTFTAEDIPGTNRIGWSIRPGFEAGEGFPTDPVDLHELSYRNHPDSLIAYVRTGSSLAGETGGLEFRVQREGDTGNLPSSHSLTTITTDGDYTRFAGSILQIDSFQADSTYNILGVHSDLGGQAHIIMPTNFKSAIQDQEKLRVAREEISEEIDTATAVLKRRFVFGESGTLREPTAADYDATNGISEVIGFDGLDLYEVKRYATTDLGRATLSPLAEFETLIINSVTYRYRAVHYQDYLVGTPLANDFYLNRTNHAGQFRYYDGTDWHDLDFTSAIYDGTVRQFAGVFTDEAAAVASLDDSSIRMLIAYQDLNSNNEHGLFEITAFNDYYWDPFYGGSTGGITEQHALTLMKIYARAGQREIQAGDIEDATLDSTEIAPNGISKTNFAASAIDTIDRRISSRTRQFARNGGRLITSADIEDETLTSADVQNGTLDSTDVEDGGLSLADMSGHLQSLISESDIIRIDNANINYTTISDPPPGYRLVEIDGPGDDPEELGDIYFFQFTDASLTPETLEVRVSVNGGSAHRIAIGEKGESDLQHLTLKQVLRYNTYLLYRESTFWHHIGGTLTDYTIYQTEPEVDARIVAGTKEFARTSGREIAGTDILDETIESEDIRNNDIASTDIADNSLTSADIQDDTIESVDIKAGTIDSTDVKDSGLSFGDLSSQAQALILGAGTGGIVRVDNDHINYTTVGNCRLVELDPPGDADESVGDLFMFQYTDDNLTPGTTSVCVSVNGSDNTRIRFVEKNEADLQDLVLSDVRRYNIFIIYRAGTFWHLVGGTQHDFASFQTAPEVSTLISNSVKIFARNGNRGIQSIDIEDGTIDSVDVNDGGISTSDLSSGTRTRLLPENPTDGQYAQWNGSNWVAVDAPDGGGGSGQTRTMIADTTFTTAINGRLFWTPIPTDISIASVSDAHYIRITARGPCTLQHKQTPMHLYQSLGNVTTGVGSGTAPNLTTSTGIIHSWEILDNCGIRNAGESRFFLGKSNDTTILIAGQGNSSLPANTQITIEAIYD